MSSVVAEKRRRAVRSGRWVQPVQGFRITTPFGKRGSMWASGYHTGSDFACPAGTPVRVTAAGTVIKAGDAGAYGTQIKVRHAPGLETWYCHLSRVVRASGPVTAGELIGYSGATGNTTGPHLHLEVRRNGVATDPAPYLDGATDGPSTPSYVNGAQPAGAVTNSALVASASSNDNPLGAEVRRLAIVLTTVLGGVALVAVGVAQGTTTRKKADR